jgi:hypothetical protein
MADSNRLHSERTSAFLVANVFLMTAFGVLAETGPEGIQFVPALVALAIVILHYLNINYGEKVMGLWQEMLLEVSPLEQRRQELFKTDPWLAKPGWGYFSRNVGSLWFPVVFFVAWTVLLIFEIVELCS